MRERERERQRHRRKEKQAPCPELDVGLDPRTPGSSPGPKAGAKLLSHPGIPSARQVTMFSGLEDQVSFLFFSFFLFSFFLFFLFFLLSPFLFLSFFSFFSSLSLFFFLSSYLFIYLFIFLGAMGQRKRERTLGRLHIQRTAGYRAQSHNPET